MEIAADIARFRKVFGEVAPEFTNPLIVETPRGKREVPFKLTGLGKDSEFGEVRAVFEARPDDFRGDDSSEDGPSGAIVKVDYAKSSGLNLRRMCYLHKESRALISGKVSSTAGELEAVLWATHTDVILLHPAIVELQPVNTNDYNIGINIVKTGDPKAFPLAFMEYAVSQQIPLNAVFPYASYEDAIKGVYETRRGRFDKIAIRRTTYFQWENLVGAKVGMTEFKADEVDDTYTYLNYYHRVTKVNNPEWTELEGTPYAAKITRSPDRHSWGRGRLRFHRKDVETGEKWMFSVPEWMDNADFIRDLSRSTLSEFQRKYPVIFWTMRHGQEKVGVIPYADKYDHDR